MKIGFCFNEFVPENIFLQPWLTVYHMAKQFIAAGHVAHVITDNPSKAKIDGIHIHVVQGLRGTNTKQITALLQNLNLDKVIVSVTPLSLISSAWYRAFKDYQAYAYISYPFFTLRQQLKAMPHLNNLEKWSYGRHLLVPKFFWVRRLVGLFKGLFCQSNTTGQYIREQTQSRINIYSFQPGIDKKIWTLFTEESQKKSKTTFLYIGRAAGIRGFFITLDAFSKLNAHDIELRILARGANENDIYQIRTELEKRKIIKRVSIRGGWLKQEELKDEIQSATAVLLPFVLIPSELPVSVMEAIACGTPVITTELAGLPETVGSAGVIVPHANAAALADAMYNLHRHQDWLARLRDQCLDQKKRMLSWDQVAVKWIDALCD